MSTLAGDVFERAPKVELHLHLEGAIPLPTLWEIIQRHGGDPEVHSIDGLRRKFAYRDFAHFIDTWWWMTGYLRTTDDFTTAAEAVARRLAAQNIVYAEASFSPTDFTRHGMSPQELGLAIRRGLDRVPAIRVTLNCDLVRDPGPEQAAATLDAVLEIAAAADIRGITIGGSEQAHPPEPFAEVYATAAAAGLHRTAHAGEAAGPGSVWGAIRALDVERIGHGVRSVEDPDLMAYLVDHQIPLEVCPTSNLCTGVAPDWPSHQVGRLLAAGAAVTISTDDPAMFHCDLAGELRTLQQHFGEAADVEQLTLAAVEASWLEGAETAALASEIRSWWDHDRSHGATREADAGFSEL